jgi:hypothetical protein
VVVAALAGLAARLRKEWLRILAIGVFEFALRDLAEPFRRQNGQDVSITVVNDGAAARGLDAGEQPELPQNNVIRSQNGS